MPSHDTPNLEITPPPTRVRYIVLAFLCSMAFVLYLDRVCIAQALKPMKDEFELSNTQMSLVSMAFTLAYGLFEIPTGRWGDRYGSRRVLTRIVLWWSAFTALTGCVWKFSYEVDFLLFPLTVNSLVLLIAIRFLFGAGEAGAIPNAARIIKLWFPLAQRGQTQGYFQASMHVGGTIAPLVAGWIIDSRAGWRGAFWLFGIVGVVWAAAFYWWFRDKPSEHPALNDAEKQLIGTTETETDSPGHENVRARAPSEGQRGSLAWRSGSDDHAIPWGEVARHPNIWLLSIIITMSAFNSYFFFTWYPTYLQEARLWDGEKVSNDIAKWLAALALAGATVGSLLGGYLADAITRRARDPYRARRSLCLLSFLAAAACLIGSVLVDETMLAAFLCALACLLMFCPLPTWWAVTFDVAGKHPGALFGLLNAAGVFGALGSQYFFGAFTDWRGRLGFIGREQWDPAFYVSASLLVAAAVLWQFVKRRPAIGS